MAKLLFHPFFMMLATIVNSELQEQIKYLKVENRILRSKLGKRVKLTPDERSRLVRFGAPLGPALKDLISIVTYQTADRQSRMRCGILSSRWPWTTPVGDTNASGEN